MALSDFAVLTAAVGFIAPAFSWRGAFADFLAHREQVKKRSPRTLDFYIWTAGDLAAWLDASAITSEAISSNVIEAWYKTHRSRAPGRRRLGNCTLHAHLRGARAFVRYCEHGNRGIILRPRLIAFDDLMPPHPKGVRRLETDAAAVS